MGASTWLRLYRSLIHDRTLQSLPAEQFKDWVNFLCLTDDSGLLPGPEELCYQLRCDATEVQQKLQQMGVAGLIKNGKFPNWGRYQHRSDSSTDRSRKCRERKRKLDVECNVAATSLQRDMQPLLQRTRTEQNRTEQNTPISPKGDRKKKSKFVLTADLLAEFEQWWADIWEKTGRANAEDSWGPARDKASLEVLLQAARLQKPGILERAKRSGSTPIHPSTWLNQERWRDTDSSMGIAALAAATSRPNRAPTVQELFANKPHILNRDDVVRIPVPKVVG